MALRILQTNLGRARAAHDLAYATAKQLNVDILIVGEPNRSISSDARWMRDRSADVAVLLINRQVVVKTVTSGKGHLCLGLQSCDLHCVYISPNIAPGEYRQIVDSVMTDVGQKSREAIVAGDINAKSPLWGSPTTDYRGEYWADWAAALNLTAHNTGTKPTFVRGRSSSFIDVTFSTQRIAKSVSKWKVMEMENLSLHRYISYDISTGNRTGRKLEKRTVSVDWDVFTPTLQLLVASIPDEEKHSHHRCAKAIAEAYRSSTVVGPRGHRRMPYWWDADISEARGRCTAARRRWARSRRRVENGETESLQRNYKDVRRELAKLIAKTKRRHWRELCEQVEDDVWGTGYQIVVKGLRKSTPYELPEKRKTEILRHLFPRQTERFNGGRSVRRPAEVEPFTATELAVAAANMKSGKAPGPDGIPADAIKKALAAEGSWLLGVVNDC